MQTVEQLKNIIASADKHLYDSPTWELLGSIARQLLTFREHVNLSEEKSLPPGWVLYSIDNTTPRRSRVILRKDPQQVAEDFGTRYAYGNAGTIPQAMVNAISNIDTSISTEGTHHGTLG